MSNSIWVAVGKGDKSLTKSAGWKDARKILVYTSETKARSAMKTRGVHVSDYEIIEYVPKGDVE